jgi:hypothetical protein
VSIVYEWCVEVVDSYGDIVDNYFADSLAQAIEWAGDDDGEYEHQICLVRTEDTFNGDRAWAYLTDDGRLPAYFADAFGHDTTKVPQRFHRETERQVTT